MSHEIRTPLNSVIGFSELLRDGGVDPREQKEYINAIAYSGNALLQLVNDVLDLSKLEADQMELLPEPCDFTGLAGEVMNVFRHRVSEKNLRLTGDLPALPELKLDKVRIRQILFNLLGNAVKFTEKGSITLSASYCPEGEGLGTLTFRVSDTGNGIAEKDIKRLMEPFVQLSQLRGTNATNNGTGLGLSICKRLVEKMNGKIRIESELGRGSTFVVELSHIATGGTPDAPERDRIPEGIPPVASAPDRSFSILLVDDVEMNLKVLRAMCRKIGISDLETASSGTEALALLEKRSFQMILTDMWMPGMSGAELAERIRRNPSLDKTPIFAVTADMETGDNFNMNAFAGVILKPITLEKIHKIIDFTLRNTGCPQYVHPAGDGEGK